MPGRRICRDNAVGMIQAEILRVLLLQHQVTADDIHDRLEIPSECMPAMAHAFRGLQMQRLIRKVAIRNTPRANQHGNRIAIWESAND